MIIIIIIIIIIMINRSCIALFSLDSLRFTSRNKRKMHPKNIPHWCKLIIYIYFFSDLQRVQLNGSKVFI